MTHQPWTCPRCSRIWAPTTKGCEACNAAVEIAAIHGFRIEGPMQLCDGEPLTPTGEAFAAEYAPWMLEREQWGERHFTVVGGTEANEALSQNAAEYLDRVQDILRGDDA